MAVYIIIFSFYVVGLPLGYLFGIYYGYGLNGLWAGMIVGIFILASSYLYLSLVYFDWENIANEAEERANDEMKKLQDHEIKDSYSSSEEEKQVLLKERLMQA